MKMLLQKGIRGKDKHHLKMYLGKESPVQSKKMQMVRAHFA
jgi:hypothetical protein